MKQLTKALLERVMQAELTDHLGYGKHDSAGYNSGNSRNGKTRKRLKGDFGEIELESPRDRNPSSPSGAPVFHGSIGRKKENQRSG